MTAVLDRSREATTVEIDHAAVIAAIVAAEGVPAPFWASLSAGGHSRIFVSLTTRDEVDEWAAMLGVGTRRGADTYQLDTYNATHPLLPTGFGLSVFCDVPPIKWQPRTSAVTA